MQKLSLNPNPKTITLQTAFSQFQARNKAYNLSLSTLNYYEQTFELFQDYTKIELCKNVIQDDIQDFTYYLLNTRKLKDVTVNSRLKNLKPFINFCIDRGYMDNIKVTLIREEETIKELYTHDEIKLLLVKPDIKKVSFSEYRNWVIVNHLVATRK